MNALTLTRMLEKSQLSVFTAQQLSRMLGMELGATFVALSRLARKGTLVRIIKGRYALPSAHPMAVASSIYPSSYVSLMVAFEYHGTITQSPRVIDVVNPSRSGRLRLELDAGRFTIRFLKATPNLMYGFDKVSVGGNTAFVASKEKAIVDCLLFSGYTPLDEVAMCIRSGIECKTIVDYAKRTRRQAVIKRLGHLLSSEGVACSPEDFGVGTMSKTYVPLDPRLPLRGKYDKVWHIVVNKVIE